MTAATKLHDFEGRQIAKTAIKIAGAGTGLSDALKVEPIEIELGEERYFVIHGTCSRVSMEEDKDEVTTRVHTLKTTDIMILDDDIARKLLAANADNLARRKAEIDGQLELEQSGYLEGAEAVAQLAEGRPLSPEFVGGE